jgi:hypothetical protein
MEWNDILLLVESLDRLGPYTILERNESVKDILILNSKIETLQSKVGELWEVKKEKTDYVDVNNNLDYLVNVRINNRVGDIVSCIEVVGLGYLDTNKLNYLKENRNEFNRFIRVHRVETKILKQLKELINK